MLVGAIDGGDHRPEDPASGDRERRREQGEHGNEGDDESERRGHAESAGAGDDGEGQGGEGHDDGGVARDDGRPVARHARARATRWSGS